MTHSPGQVDLDISFTDRELDVMAVLWERGSGTVTEVRDGLEDDLAYNTVLTILRTIEDKGFVTHVTEGKAHRYVPAVSAKAAGKRALARVVDKIFGGSPELVLTQLVSDRDLSPHDLRRLRKLLDARLAGDSSKGRS